MFKMFGFAVITAATTFTGNYFAGLLKSRLICLKKMNYMTDEMIMFIRFRSLTVYEIVKALRDSGRFAEFGFLENISLSGNVPFGQSWCSAVAEDPPRGLNKRDIEILADIGRKLGTSDTESQLNTLELQRAEILSEISAAETDSAEKSKLYRSIGVLAGAFISIMLV